MRKYCFVLLCIVVIGLYSLPMKSQRLAPHLTGVELMGGVPLRMGEKVFAPQTYTLSFGIDHYLNRGHYLLGLLEYERQESPYFDYHLQVQDGWLQLGYMHSLISDRAKNVLVYFGVMGLIGCEELNGGHYRFLYGGSLQSSMEVFITDNILFILRGQGRFIGGTESRLFCPSVVLGLKFHI